MTGSSRDQLAPARTGAFSFALTVAFWPGIIGAATTPRWALLSIVVPACLFFLPPSRAEKSTWAGRAFLALAAISLAWTFDPLSGLDRLWKLCLLAGLFAIGARLPSLRPVYLGAAVGLAVNGLIAFAQWLGWQGIPQMVAPAGLFINKNFLAETAALVLVGLIVHRLWWGVPLVLPALLLPQARAALVAVGAGLAVMLMRRSRWASAGIILGIFFVVVFVAMGGTGQQRIALWLDVLHNLTWLGHGLGAYALDRISIGHAHNDYLEIAYDLGPAGAVLFVALLATAISRDCADRTVIFAFAVLACFSFPLALPATAALAAIVAGHLCAHRVVVRDSIHDGRFPFYPWVDCAGPSPRPLSP